ncbi:hypothetical protein OFN48_34340, partial [Escherichia coli]|nr:hypothetical protein [Escherichia coli]
LEHNREEEAEHAAMSLEWLRRHDPELDRHLRRYLFSDGPIAGREAGSEGDDRPAPGDGSLGIGGLRGEAGR